MGIGLSYRIRNGSSVVAKKKEPSSDELTRFREAVSASLVDSLGAGRRSFPKIEMHKKVRDDVALIGDRSGGRINVAFCNRAKRSLRLSPRMTLICNKIAQCMGPWLADSARRERLITLDFP